MFFSWESRSGCSSRGSGGVIELLRAAGSWWVACAVTRLRGGEAGGGVWRGVSCPLQQLKLLERKHGALNGPWSLVARWGNPVVGGSVGVCVGVLLG